MKPGSVVEGFDKIKDGFCCGVTRGKFASINALQFQGAPKGFHRRIVVAVCFSAHTGKQAVAGQDLPVGSAGVLNASIGMMD
jgi:hypothetical protein